MELTAAKKKQYRALGHSLKPVVTVAEKGLTDNVNKEINRALRDHELIKVKLNFNDPAGRRAMGAEICADQGAQLVQAIGKIVLIYRAAKKPNPKLSNLLRPA